VLPTLAQCTASPGLPGCGVVLPPLAKCVASPGLVGCSVVFSLTGTNTSVLAQALDSTVDLVNTSVTGNSSTAPKPGDAKTTDASNVAGAKSDGIKKTYCN
jgi:hypothetical protein